MKSYHRSSLDNGAVCSTQLLLLDPVPYPELLLDRGGDNDHSYLSFPLEGACFAPCLGAPAESPSPETLS